MKKTLVLIAIVTVAGTIASFFAARWLSSRNRPQMVVNLHDTAWLRRELKLTDGQARKVEAYEREFQAKLDGSCASHCAARFALGDELAKPTVDSERARACVERMNEVQAAAERATLEHILKVRELLDVQQAQRYSTLIQRQVCSMPMGAP